MYTTSLFCIATLMASAAVMADPIKVPLFQRRHGDGLVKGDAEVLQNGVLGGKVSIGTPPQEFVMAFDTSSGYSWVRGSQCKNDNCLNRCTYYATESETVTWTGRKLRVKYDHACVETNVYLDTVEFSGIKVHNQPFGSAYRMTGFDAGFDGYFGLGRSVDFNKTTIITSPARAMMRRDLPDSAFIPNAYQQGSGLQSSQFGMYTTSSSDNGFGSSGVAPSSSSTTTTSSSNGNTFGEPQTTTPQSANNTPQTTTSSSSVLGQQPTTSTTTSPVTSGGFGFLKRTVEEPAGYLVLGGIDESAIEGEVYYMDLAEHSVSWDLPITKISFDKDLVIEQKPGAIASISTSDFFISMPADQADIYHKVFGGRFLEPTQTYKVKCSHIKHMPTLKMYFGDYAVEIPPQYWTRVIDADSDCCATRIARSEAERDWVLGTSFTNLFYTVFDPVKNQVGLALKKGQPCDGLRIVKVKKH